MTPLVLMLLAQDPSLVTTTGYLDSRTQLAETKADGTPAVTELVEGNVQLKLTPHPRVTVQVDASLFWQGAWAMHGGDLELPQYRPSIVLSEAYVDLTPQDSVRVLVGKKRVVWGSGLAFNPTDVLNPPKDPTDPTFQRAGAWLGLLEFPFEKVTLSLAAAGRVTRSYAGLPTALVTFPEQPTYEVTQGWVAETRDDEAHWGFVSRLYLLVADTDVTVSYAYTNLLNDAFAHKSRAGLSLSRTFGGLEVHGEALAMTGSTRVDVTRRCINQPQVCFLQGTPIATRPDVDATYFNANALAGARWFFEDGGILTGEYFFNGDGHDADGFRDAAYLFKRYPQQVQAALGASQDPGTPQKFAFTPLRRHYAVLSYLKPQLFDDWTVLVSLLTGLEDLSMQALAQVTWAPWEWLNLTAAVYVPLPGVPDWGVTVDDTQYGELTLNPFGTRVLLQARVFY